MLLDDEKIASIPFLRGTGLSKQIPTTRHSLLARLSDLENAAAWGEFEATYVPAIYRIARRRGLQPSSAEDLTQQVMLAVTHKIPDWDANSDQGSFRAWLLTVTKNALINVLSRKPADEGRGGSGFAELGEIASRDASSLDEIDWEFRRAWFRKVAGEIETEFRHLTWQSFWLTAVEQQPAATTAKQLGISVGAVYTNRCRVLKRFREFSSAYCDPNLATSEGVSHE